LRTVPAGTELWILGAEVVGLLLVVFEPAGVRGVLKGCATAGLEVAEGLPEAERGVAVVEVSVVVGVE